MIKPKIEGERVVIGPCRLSYVHVFEPWGPEGDPNKKYMVNVIIPKKEKETISALKEAIEAAKKKGVTDKWRGKLPKSLDISLRDGDERESAGEEFAGSLYINAKSIRRPGMIDREGNPITDEEEIYSGVWCYVSLSFFPYCVNGNSGVAAALNNLKKFKDDERLGGGASAEADFSGIDDEDDEDL